MSPINPMNPPRAAHPRAGARASRRSKPRATPAAKSPMLASVELSLPAARTVRGYEIGRMPIGRFLRAARRIDGVPEEVLARLFPDAEDAVRALASLDRAGLIALYARALTVLPDEAVTVFAELASLDEKALRDDPNVGLDGLMEMIEAWVEVNNLENFIIAARTLARRVRAGMTGTGSNG